jgi:hypothetical protein
MKTRALFTTNALIFALLACAAAASAQEHDPPKVEIGVQFTSLSINHPFGGGTENAVGIGARATYNFTDYFAVEAEGNVLPTGTSRSSLTGGGAQQAQFGVKVGKRWKTFGLFAKARPGFVSFDDTLDTGSVTSSGPFGFPDFGRERKTHFSTDVGGVLEFYPSRKMLVRFDVGDTIIRYGEHDEPLFFGGIPGGLPTFFTAPSETRHNFQFSAGVGFRLGGGDDGGAAPSKSGGSGREPSRRFEVGVQFSSFMLNLSPRDFGAPSFAPFDAGSNAEAGGGLRVGYNVTKNLALEAEGNFYPRRRDFFNNTTVGGYPAQVQAGVKYGRRFDRFGLFAKARPGFVHFSRVAHVTSYDPVNIEGQQYYFADFDSKARTYFSMDVGGVLEFYPSERLFTRFDVGDTMIRYPERDNPGFFFNTPTPAPLPAELRHNLQVTAGIGLRF